MTDEDRLRLHVLNKPPSFLFTNPDYLLTTEEQSCYNALLKRYRAGEPVAYLTGAQGFWKHDFKVTPDVLIPRPATELLVELALGHIRSAHANEIPPLRANARGQGGQGGSDQLTRSVHNIIDLGTGSGCIAISLALECPNAHITAIDQSSAALTVAQENAARLNAKNITWLNSNWFSNLSPMQADLILSNPPYIQEDDPHLPALCHEPPSALSSGKTGLTDIETIIKSAQAYLKPHAPLLIEHGYDQAPAVTALFKKYAYENVNTHADLQGHPRVTMGHRPSNIKGFSLIEVLVALTLTSALVLASSLALNKIEQSHARIHLSNQTMFKQA